MVVDLLALQLAGAPAIARLFVAGVTYQFRHMVDPALAYYM